MTVLSLSRQLVRGQRHFGWVKEENYFSSPVTAHKTRHQSPEAPTPVKSAYLTLSGEDLFNSSLILTCLNF